jgi:class 3 adenylate cyclase
MESQFNTSFNSEYNKKTDELANCLENTSDTILFSGICENCCVCIVDAVNSTKITAHMSKSKMCTYYSIFLNSVAKIAREHGASVVKNIGDSLLYYFPAVSGISKRTQFIDSLECGLAMIDSHDVINNMMHAEGLPSVDYRISADYGSIMTAKTAHSSMDDVFGSTVNICAKINSQAIPNSMVIGGDLYSNVKSFMGYKFKLITGYSVGLKLQYPVYSITRC